MLMQYGNENFNVLDVAIGSAINATNEYLEEHGENPMGCGFAWVDVKGVRGKKLELLKSYGFKKKYVGTGHSLWNPSKNFTQDMDAKYAGAVACAEVLRKYGIDATAGCRLD